ncbi:MAG: polysaccharide biosynthesis protein PslG [Mycobacterium sp.]|nr:polysaccharide biosynthesis protein PslG [Mycobacterium sp.]
MRGPRRPPRRRIIQKLVAGLTVGVLTTAVVWFALPSRHPREVDVAQTARMAALPTTIGFHDPDSYFMTDADVNQTFDKMLQTGVKNVRLMIPWAGAEPVQNQFDWTNVDRTVNAAVARNMAVIGIINASPAWAVAPGVPAISGRPASPAQYADFCEKVAARYRGKVSAYEVWNEPNGAQFFAPVPDPPGYTELLKAAYPKIKAADPNATVIGGVVGSVVDWGTWLINPVTFVQQMYDAGAKNFMDALSFHPYHYSLKFSDGYAIANSPLDQTVALRRIMVANGDASKKIWATEYGEPMTATDEAGQAAYIMDLITKWQEMPYTGPIMIHTTRDRQTGSTDVENVFGVYRTDWSAKPAQVAMKDAIAAGIPKSAEYQRFSAITDPSYGEVLSPVYRATPTVWAQARTISTLFETPTGIIASPTPVADKARQFGVAPTTQFQNGYQDFDSPSGMRVWWSPATGAHAVGGGFVAAWTPPLGLALTDEVREGWATKVTFEHGYITWLPWICTQVTFT